MRGQRTWFVWQFARGRWQSKVCFKNAAYLVMSPECVGFKREYFFIQTWPCHASAVCVCVSVCTGVGLLACLPGQLGMPARVLMHTNCANSLGSIKLLCTLLSIPFDPFKTLPSKGWRWRATNTLAGPGLRLEHERRECRQLPVLSSCQEQCETIEKLPKWKWRKFCRRTKRISWTYPEKLPIAFIDDVIANHARLRMPWKPVSTQACRLNWTLPCRLRVAAH